jgi:hypothetical protein
MLKTGLPLVRNVLYTAHSPKAEHCSLTANEITSETCGRMSIEFFRPVESPYDAAVVAIFRTKAAESLVVRLIPPAFS